ncbi:Hypothetical predicted protein [Scomber scombrus]|uniref:Uncharacterized protein n=1 Tax=Scomber scombrus TaxID=13677 RepID=A0AAV1QD45_SCOSC
MYVLHALHHLRVSINLEVPLVNWCDAALLLVKLEDEAGHERLLSVIGRQPRGSCKFRRHVLLIVLKLDEETSVSVTVCWVRSKATKETDKASRGPCLAAAVLTTAGQSSLLRRLLLKP